MVEPVSLDEAFLEPPQLVGATTAEVERFAAALRADVRAATGCPRRSGRGLASSSPRSPRSWRSPTVCASSTPPPEHDVLAPLPVRMLWGVGPVAEAALHRAGVQTVGELAALDAREAARLLGGTVGTELHRLAQGIDDRPVAPRGAAKQVSAETTFDVDLTAMSAVHDAVARLAESAHRRLLASGRAARTVTVKVRSADFTTATRSETAAEASTDLAVLTATAQRLARTAVPEGGVRLLGVSLAGLGEEPPPALFATAPEQLRGAAAGRGACPPCPLICHGRGAPATTSTTPTTATAGCRARATAASPSASRRAAAGRAGPSPSPPTTPRCGGPIHSPAWYEDVHRPGRRNVRSA